MKKIINKLTPFFLFAFLISCKEDEKTMFSLVDSKQTGIHFENKIVESDTLNIINEEYIYNGGGVAVGDFNNDGLPDLYFTGNMVDNKLYINKGNLRFEDISQISNISAEGKWCSGVSVVDINNDGWLDIYVSVTLHKDSVNRKNLLYVNKGLDNNGIPIFIESANSYGIDDSGNSTHSSFFDYDNDGDLDLYLLTNFIDTKVPTNYRKRNIEGTALNNDRLYRNNGNGTFQNVTKEAGILYEGFGLGITVSDVNLDGWLDIYIANDYISNDLLYINNQDGTFTNKISDYLKHQSYSSMGVDVVDINNDAFVDIITVDMLPGNNQRKKQMLGPNNYVTYINNDKFEFEHQYVRNVLQLNNGLTSKGHPSFSDIGQLAGIFETDWSWTPLVADFDNDGFRDIIITNGFPKDVTDRDFATYISGPAGLIGSSMMLQDSIPVVKIANYVYKNNGDLSFSDLTQDWGLNIPSFSNGAVYTDLDNDGDLDFVVNNINDKAFVYKNNINDGKAINSNFIRLKLVGTKNNPIGVGTKITIHANGKKQYFEQSLSRGYLSSIEDVAHFGLGNGQSVDSIQIFWPDNKYQLIKNVTANQLIQIHHKDAKDAPVEDYYKNQIVMNEPLTKEVSKNYNIQFKHVEEDRVDFNLQKTLPHKYSQMGPGIAVADINGDEIDDFFIGGAAGYPGTYFVQNKDGKFNEQKKSTLLKSSATESMGVLFFDAENDGDQDLYVVSGSYEYKKEDSVLQDQLYINNGLGDFKLDNSALPKSYVSGSCVKAADYNSNGYLDLFVGGRIVPGEYPQPAKSTILQNEKGHFIDVTDEICPELNSLGLISDALWTDFNGDGKIDLIVVGEWIPVTFFKNDGTKLINVTSSTGISSKIGWWNSISASDYDNDGDIDYVVGNLGLNTHFKASESQPLSVYAKDFDQNGSMDAILAMYLKNDKGELKLYPMHNLDDMISQMVRFRRQFPKYKDYGKATINEVLNEDDLKDALVLKATHFASSYIENLGSGEFSMKELPLEGQFAPVNGILSEDVDLDGNTDLLIVGNNYASDVFTGRYDAMIGLYLKGDGKGNFKPMKVNESGFFVDGDAKGISKLYTAQGKELYIVTQNQDSLKVFSKIEPNQENVLLRLQSNDAKAELHFEDGKKLIREFYYGSTYLSQSSRTLSIDKKVSKVIIYEFSGNQRIIEMKDFHLLTKK